MYFSIPSPKRRASVIAWSAVTVFALVTTGCANRVPLSGTEALQGAPGGQVVEPGTTGLNGIYDSSGSTQSLGDSYGTAGSTGGTGGATGSNGSAAGSLGSATGSTGATGGGTGTSRSGGQAGGGVEAYDSGASKTAINVGSVSALTGLFSDFMQPRGARAYFKMINAQGGINGRKINLNIYDDQWDATQNAALTQQAAKSDNVFAFVANMAPLSSHGGMSFNEKNGYAVVGGDMIDLQNWGKSPNYYPQAALESVAGGRVGGRATKIAGCHKVAGFSLAVNESRSWTSAFEKGMGDVGLGKYVYSADISFAETDYTPYISQAKSRGADCITFGGQTNNFLRLMQTMGQQNYNATLVLPSSAYDPGFVEEAKKHPNIKAYSTTPFDLLENAGSNPAIAQFVNAAKAYEPSMKVNGYAILAWVSAQIFTEAIRRMGNNITRANLIKTLDGMKNFKTGIVSAISYSPGPHQGSRCANEIQLVSGKWKVVQANSCV